MAREGQVIGRVRHPASEGLHPAGPRIYKGCDRERPCLEIRHGQPFRMAGKEQVQAHGGQCQRAEDGRHTCHEQAQSQAVRRHAPASKK